jgi:hypothetical protein
MTTDTTTEALSQLAAGLRGELIIPLSGRRVTMRCPGA